MTDIRPLLVLNTNDDVARAPVEYTIEYRTRFNETRIVSHLTLIDAQERAIHLRARGYRVHVRPTFVM